MRSEISKNKGKAILTTSIILVALVLIVFAGVASACAPAGEACVEEHIEHIASDLCAMGSSVKLISYAAIGLVLIKLVELIISLKKK